MNIDPTQAKWDALTPAERQAVLDVLDADIAERRATMPPWTTAELAWEAEGAGGIISQRTNIPRILLLVVRTRQRHVNRRRLAKGDG